MPTYWSQTLIPTARQVPGEAEVPSHRLLLRAGFIRRLGSGVYDYLPLGLRSLRKIMEIVRQEMDAAGGIEVFLPSLQPVELWEQTGRRAAYGENLFVVKDRHGREQALGPTHEEVMTELVSGYVESYKQLPLTLYQIQTKFRDEYRPRFGVLRSREFQMKDAYSYHMTLEGPGGLDETYDRLYDAYCKIFTRCGVPYEIVEAESGPIGGSASHEFMVPSPTGEDVILKSDKGNYAANVEKCEIGPRDHAIEEPSTGNLEKIHTPGCPGIDDVVTFFKKELKTKLKTQNMLKTLVFVATGTDDNPDPTQAKDPWYVLAVVRGDHDVNESKLRAAVSRFLSEPVVIGLAPEGLAKADGWKLGFVGPHAVVGRNDTLLVVDPDAAQGGFWVTGANKTDHHVKHFNWQRDVVTARGRQLLKKVKAALESKPGAHLESAGAIEWDPDKEVLIGDIRNAADGDPSPLNDGGVLRETKGIEIGHVFKLGRKYSESMDMTVLDENNERRHPIMGCYGIGINRIMAGAIECDSGHDEYGIVWPVSIAPYTVVITPIKYDGPVKETTLRVATDLEQLRLPDVRKTGIPGRVDVLIDDRDERPGVKFKDADLIGVPIRITIGDKALDNGQVEVKTRTAEKAELVAVDQVAQRIGELVASLSGQSTTMAMNS